MNFAPNTIWTCDNLYVMRGMNSESVDLIYLDPPFNSKADYAAPIGSAAAGAAFKDTWTLNDLDAEWIDSLEATEPHLFHVILAAMTASDKSYLVYMAMRLLEMRRLLKPTGSIYLHCDPTMSHYLKLIMDAVFGQAQFRNEIVWAYRRWTAPSGDLQRLHDVILWYCKDRDRRTYNTIWVLPANVEKGRNESYEADSDGRLFRWQTANGKRYKIYRDKRGVHAGDVWMMPFLHPSAKERLGYPTQKPLALLNRIIRASSNPGDMIFDPFCGCATTMVAAHALGDRQWLGIDISPKAAELVVERLTDLQGAMFTDYVHRADIPLRTDLGALPRYNCTANKQALYGRQEGDCAACNEHFAIRHLEVDHIIARSKGGTDHLGNLQLLCAHCNRVKGDRGMNYLREKLQLVA